MHTAHPISGGFVTETTAWFYQSGLSPDGVNNTDTGPQMKVAVSNQYLSSAACYMGAGSNFFKGEGQNHAVQKSFWKEAGMLACPLLYGFS